MKAARLHEYHKPLVLNIIRFEQINESLDLLRRGKIVGRVVVKM